MTRQQTLEIALSHHMAGRFAGAESLYRQLLVLYPNDPELLHLLGALAHDTGRPEEALALLEEAVSSQPGAILFRNRLGLLLTDLGRLDEAVAAFRECIRLQPGWHVAHYNLGNARLAQRHCAAAVDAYRDALRIRPDDVPAAINLGNALSDAGRADEAVAQNRAAIERHPSNAALRINLGNLLKAQGWPDAAVECYRAAIALAPGDATPRSNLGVALKDLGEIDASIESFCGSLSVDPCRADVRSNLIFTMCFDSRTTAETLAGEHGRWNERHAAPLRGERRPHTNDPSPERRLRIGWVSGDLREHAVGRTLLPCFEAHDRERFDLVCYSGTAPSDPVAERFRTRSEWREIARLSDEELAARIREDRIDILVDLSLHTAGNRLPVFARKPAPVQVSWLGYPGSTGLDTIDYRITDPYLEPAAGDDAERSEKPLRLPDCWTCYAAPEDSPEPGELPALRDGRATFGSFNNFAKINGRVLALWAGILRAVEGSRLLLLSKGRGVPGVLEFFERHGIAAGRVEFLSFYPESPAQGGACGANAYLERYRRIDIALDPFPYNGMTTTCDALWMGVPVVALIGGMPVSRASFSLLTNVGLPGLAAHSEEDYARIAVELARDLPRLGSLRATLRERMKCSPLLDAARFARNLEAAWRGAWRVWCANQGAGQS